MSRREAHWNLAEEVTTSAHMRQHNTIIDNFDDDD
tara:strand:- start:458 stop:562 length:105 start_codon:yes stop_codon:yes gene_type:complete